MNAKIKITPENIQELKPNEIFIFGSNLGGFHGGGAALLAKEKFGAVIGVGEGITGQCYALPTKDKNIETLPIGEIHKSVEVLYQHIQNNTDKFFLVTAVGCGLAGYTAKDIAPMFEPFVHLNNCSLPQSFMDVIFPPKIFGYKVMDKNMQCRGYQFTMNKIHKTTGEIKACESGFHFCKKLVDCFDYYPFESENRVFEVEGIGDYDFEHNKICTREIKVLKELSWFEVLSMVNTGKGNSGKANSGDRNSGNYNSGDCNSGYYNSGDCNSGYYNSGDCNSGNYNSGDCNSGYYNSGYRNSGYYNSGYYNSGYYNSGYYNSGYYNSGECNSGYYNSGDCNSGYYNSGYYNSGYYNSGNRNSGYYNSGYYNSGYYNSGNRNSGYYNSGDRNSGYFNNDEPFARIFGKETDIKVSNVNIPYITLKTTEWIPESDMTDNEKKDNPKFFVTQGYLKTRTYKDAWKLYWENDATESEKKQFLALPNFDADIFEDITGIRVNL